MRKVILGIVLGSLLMFTETEAKAQVSWVWPDQFVSVGDTKLDFHNWLNNERAIRGLQPLNYDVSLEADCHQNNLWQAVYGLGHFYFGRAIRQNASAVTDFGKVGPCWMTSAGHYAALMDPNVQWYAIMQYGIYTTFSAY